MLKEKATKKAARTRRSAKKADAPKPEVKAEATPAPAPAAEEAKTEE